MKRSIAIKNLIKNGVLTREICKKLKVNRQLVSYWRHNEVKEIHYKKKKLPSKYLNWIINKSKDKPVSEMSLRTITRILNKKLEKDKVKDSRGNQLKMGYKTISNILNKFIGKPRKIRKVFYLSEVKKQKRVEFCKMILDKSWTGKEIFFSNETQIDLSNYVNDPIRLRKKNEEKLKRRDLEVYELITRPKKKF